jgi:hypothetical protein
MKSKPGELLTISKIKELMGWVEEAEGQDFGDDYLFVNPYTKKKVRCTNNIANRPIYLSNVETIKRDVLNRFFEYNGEVIIIGITGLVLNGQHTMIAAVFAEHERTGPDKAHWKEVWGDNPITLDKDVTYGVSEEDRVVNTIDTAKSRTFGDVMYRSDLVKDVPPGDRKAFGKACDNAARLLWVRTGGESGGWVGKKKGKHTHREMDDFLRRHERLVQCVRHVFDENVSKSVSTYFPVGYSAAVMYLMATSDTDAEAYQLAPKKDESLVNFDQWDKAREFWTKFANSKDDTMKEVRYALAALNDETQGAAADKEKKIAIIALAWDQWRDGKTPTAAGCKLKMSEPNDKGAVSVLEWPDYGGIDRGYDPPKESAEDDDEEDGDAEANDDDEVPAETKPKRQVNKPPKHDKGAIDRQLAELRTKHPDRVLFIRGEGAWLLWEQDAEVYAKITGGKFVQKGGLICASILPENFLPVIEKIVAAGHKAAQCYPGATAKEWTVTDWVPTPGDPSKPTTAPPKPGGSGTKPGGAKPGGKKPSDTLRGGTNK